jgi:hypothetical protein
MQHREHNDRFLSRTEIDGVRERLQQRLCIWFETTGNCCGSARIRSNHSIDIAKKARAETRLFLVVPAGLLKIGFRQRPNDEPEAHLI